jgi:hypothetical protein
MRASWLFIYLVFPLSSCFVLISRTSRARFERQPKTAQNAAAPALVVATCVLFATGLTHSPASAQRNECLTAHTDAQLLRKQGSLLQAREKLLDCSQSSCPRLVVNDCTGWLSEVEASLSSVVFAVSDEQGRDISDARVSGNGHLIVERTDGRAVLLDPGTYDFAFEAPGYENATESISLRQSEKDRIVRVVMPHVAPEVAAVTADSGTPELPPSAATDAAPVRTHKDYSTAMYLLGGTGLLGVGTFAFFGLNGNAKLHEVERCVGDCSSASRAGKRDYLIADIGLAVAVATIPILVYLAIDSAHSETTISNQSVQLRALAAQRGASLEWSGSF